MTERLKQSWNREVVRVAKGVQGWDLGGAVEGIVGRVRGVWEGR